MLKVTLSLLALLMFSSPSWGMETCQWTAQAVQEDNMGQFIRDNLDTQLYRQTPRVYQDTTCNQKVCSGMVICFSQIGRPTGTNTVFCRANANGTCPTANECFDDPTVTWARPYPTEGEIESGYGSDPKFNQEAAR